MNEERETAAARDDLVRAWGDLGVLWGIPRTTARIQGLLLASGEPLSLDQIITTLGVSKGGASSRLAELRQWGIARRVAVPGDRRDWYEASDDVWASFLTMIRARKRGEFDPVATRLRDALSRLTAGASPRTAIRLGEAGEILETMDGLGERLLSAGRATRAVLRFLSRRGRKGKQ